MTFAEYRSDAHGALAKTRWGKLCSRDDGNRLADIIADEWMTMCWVEDQMPPTKEEARKALTLRCTRRLKEQQKVGFSILVIILTAALGAIINILIEYWWEKWQDRDKSETLT